MDDAANVLTRVYYDRLEQKTVVAQIQDVAPIFEDNAKLRGIEQRSDWGRHVARIPNVFLEKILNDAHARGNTSMKLFDREFMKEVKKLIKDRDFNKVRVDAKTIGWSGWR